ncbi:uncharacterized protein PV07_05282 [Cladophialophora immunda]|uniref:Heterokaryon incompatibility domain-containing protein n=1 Tax=Cladophialophora immunda TaxID=569365 RepID=A0A0D2CEC1_9EURO|nr:uncharacterized protein PV07_05282 [Cladophialophora immunda]KIW29468.1 hypothetical protein PV07_05282 [Cladophialophora immunda]OQV00625.1 hypothetical protein CLAIMM_06098 [Cladophialophora immunda]
MDFEQEVLKFKSLDFHPDQFEFLSECLDSHKICQRAVGLEQSLPKRLLYLGKPSGTAFPSRLVETKDIEERPVRYVALSHSWSSLSEAEKRSIKTTADNKTLRAQAVDISAFPGNYQAVMVMCRSFGYEYFWMDSICILQDDDKEWQDESVRMKHVYGAAVLTFALNTSQAIFDMVRSNKGALDWGDITDEYARSMFKIDLHAKRIFESGILGSRAWCFQERHLSPRLLHILDDRVVMYECAQATMATNAPDLFGFRSFRRTTSGEKFFQLESSLRKLAVNQRLIEIKNGARSGLRVHLEYWPGYLLEYQRRALFDNKDNLTALAGIAESMQAEGHWTYLSGIWKEDLPRGMLWESTALSQTSHKRFRPYHAPTWSWSSVDGSTRTVPELVNSHGGVFGICERHKRDPEPFISLISGISIRTAGTGLDVHVDPLPPGSALELEGILIRCKCRRLDDQHKITGLFKSERTSIVAEGTIAFDVDSEACDGPLWCLPLVEKHLKPGWVKEPALRDCLGIGLQKVSVETLPGRVRTESLGEGEGEGEELVDRSQRMDLVQAESLEDHEERAIDTFRRVGFVRLTLTEGAWTDHLSSLELLRII